MPAPPAAPRCGRPASPPTRLDTARELGAAHAINSGDLEPADALAGSGVRADVIFEVSGSAAGLESALRAAAPGTRIVAVGIQKAPHPVRIAEWTLSEYDVLGVVAHVCGTDLPEALDLLAAGGAWASIAPAVLPLEDLVVAGLIPLGLGEPGQVKTLFDPSATVSRAADHGRVSGGNGTLS